MGRGDPPIPSVVAPDVRVVRSAWRRLEAWCRRHAPGLLDGLNPPASDARIACFERLIGRELPEVVRESYRIHDGQAGEGKPCGLVWGLPILSLDMASALWKQDREIEDESAASFLSSSPEGAIRLSLTGPGWIPLSMDWGGAHFGIDLQPGPTGHAGQVITFGRDNDRYVIAWSWDRFLTGVATELEAGNFRLRKAAGDDEEEELWFSLLRPPREHFHDAVAEVYRRWARASRARR